jgi:hypothetical protein
MVAPARVVGIDPFALVLFPVAQIGARRPCRHLGSIERQVGPGPDHPLEFDQHPGVERIGQLTRIVGGPEPTPQHEIGTGCDSRCRIVLQQRQVAYDIEKVCRLTTVQKLGADRDPACVTS